MTVVKAPSIYPTIAMDPKIDEALWIDAFLHPIFGFMMTHTKHDLLTKFLKMKPITF